ncbi:hypothetical protein ACS5PU_10430 [Pedobacter sp. GSP4]|uniref:hypothetical protein n=1 Tax=Pedobacter sp. GSP4 TaxID=3453716 RepID=UPI003EECDAA8
MKKLSLNPNAFDKGEVLTRAQLKKVMGGGSAPESGESPKITACQDKKDGDYCVWTYEGTSYEGHCRSYLASPLACSSLI